MRKQEYFKQVIFAGIFLIIIGSAGAVDDASVSFDPETPLTPTGENSELIITGLETDTDYTIKRVNDPAVGGTTQVETINSGSAGIIDKEYNFHYTDPEPINIEPEGFEHKIINEDTEEETNFYISYGLYYFYLDTFSYPDEEDNEDKYHQPMTGSDDDSMIFTTVEQDRMELSHPSTFDARNIGFTQTERDYTEYDFYTNIETPDNEYENFEIWIRRSNLGSSNTAEAGEDYGFIDLDFLEEGQDFTIHMTSDGPDTAEVKIYNENGLVETQNIALPGDKQEVTFYNSISDDELLWIWDMAVTHQEYSDFIDLEQNHNYLEFNYNEIVEFDSIELIQDGDTGLEFSSDGSDFFPLPNDEYETLETRTTESGILETSFVSSTEPIPYQIDLDVSESIRFHENETGFIDWTVENQDPDRDLEFKIYSENPDGDLFEVQDPPTIDPEDQLSGSFDVSNFGISEWQRFHGFNNMRLHINFEDSPTEDIYEDFESENYEVKGSTDIWLDQPEQDQIIEGGVQDIDFSSTVFPRYEEVGLSYIVEDTVTGDSEGFGFEEFEATGLNQTFSETFELEPGQYEYSVLVSENIEGLDFDEQPSWTSETQEFSIEGEDVNLSIQNPLDGQIVESGTEELETNFSVSSENDGTVYLVFGEIVPSIDPDDPIGFQTIEIADYNAEEGEINYNEFIEHPFVDSEWLGEYEITVEFISDETDSLYRSETNRFEVEPTPLEVEILNSNPSNNSQIDLLGEEEFTDIEGFIEFQSDRFTDGSIRLIDQNTGNTIRPNLDSWDALGIEPTTREFEIEEIEAGEYILEVEFESSDFEGSDQEETKRIFFNVDEPDSIIDLRDIADQLAAFFGITTSTLLTSLGFLITTIIAVLSTRIMTQKTGTAFAISSITGIAFFGMIGWMPPGTSLALIIVSAAIIFYTVWS